MNICHIEMNHDKINSWGWKRRLYEQQTRRETPSFSSAKDILLTAVAHRCPCSRMPYESGVAGHSRFALNQAQSIPWHVTDVSSTSYHQYIYIYVKGWRRNSTSGWIITTRLVLSDRMSETQAMRVNEREQLEDAACSLLNGGVNWTGVWGYEVGAANLPCFSSRSSGCGAGEQVCRIEINSEGSR